MSADDGFITIRDKTFELVTLDFETFYASDYSLASGKMNMSEYIRDPRFLSHGVGIKLANGPTRWYTGANIVRALHNIDWSDKALLCHNTAFDGFVLHEHFGIHPAFYLDTLSMSRAAHGNHELHNLDVLAQRHGLKGKTRKRSLVETKGKSFLSTAELSALGAYAKDDVDDTYGVFWKMYQFIPDAELELIDLTMRMFCEPVLKMDMKLVEGELRKELGGKAAALFVAGTTVDQLMSNENFANLLRSAGTTPPMKTSPTTGKRIYAFSKSDPEFQYFLRNASPRVVDLVDARLKVRSTIGESRASRFIEAGCNDQLVPVALNYAGAHTLRWSGGNKMNLQNLPRGGALRRSLLAPEGHVIVVCDSAQIEARVTAWLAKHSRLIGAFAAKKDVYIEMAAAIYGVPAEQITKDQRFIGKICVLGLGYGMGAEKLQKTLEVGAFGPAMKLSLFECQRIVSLYRSMNQEIVGLWDSMSEVLANMLGGVFGKFGPLSYGPGYIKLPNDLFLHYSDLEGSLQDRWGRATASDVSYRSRYGRTRIYGGLLTENVVQALARCIIADQMLEVSRRYRVVTMTHDEIVAICPADEADECYEFIKHTMCTPPKWAPDLPLNADGGYDVCYSK